MALMLDHLFTSIADAGRDLLRSRSGQRQRDVGLLTRDLLSTRGEASGMALARDLVAAYRAMGEAQRLAFLTMIATDLGPDPSRVQAAAAAYGEAPGPLTLRQLRKAAEPPRQELFRRMNVAPGGIRVLIGMRSQLLRLMADHPVLAEVDADLQYLLTSWFNPGFLTLVRIDWHSPASLLEKLVKYERVHRMQGIEDMRRRLAADRRCYAFFHPALADEPLIFVQVALTDGLADKVQPLLDAAAPVAPPGDADSAIFYAISNCQDGLRGITLGNFLIKLVVSQIELELPKITIFSTLSPVPGFAAWLAQERAQPSTTLLTTADLETLTLLDVPGWHERADEALRLRPLLTTLCAAYLVRVKDERGRRPIDPVARFHLGNGARLERINWLADVSPNGLAQSFGLLVNYRYDPPTIEKNHELFAHQGDVIHSHGVRALLPKPGQTPKRDAESRKAPTAESSG